MTKIDLTGMTYAELNAHMGAVQIAMDAAKETSRKAALAAVHRLANEHGFQLWELNDRSGVQAATKQSKPASVAKYAHPTDPSITWSGRGRKPQWIVDGLAKGFLLEGFAI